MNKLFLSFLLVCTFITLGCTNPLTKVTPVTCKETDWSRVGRCFGRSNESALTKNYYPDLCAKKDMPVDQAAFDKGYFEGRTEVCAERKLAYFYAADFCRAGAAKRIQNAIDDGLTAKFLRDRLASSVERMLKAKENAEERAALETTSSAPPGYAVDTQFADESETDIKEQTAKDRTDLAALDKKYYPMPSADVFYGSCNAIVKDVATTGAGLTPAR